MEDGATGLVLHTKDHTKFLCIKRSNVPYLDQPAMDEVLVYKSHRQALTMQHFWNHQRDDGQKVYISLRREALQEYIMIQQTALDIIMSWKPFDGGLA